MTTSTDRPQPTSAVRTHVLSMLGFSVVALWLGAVASGPSLDRWAQRKSDGTPRAIASSVVAPAVVSARRSGLFALRERIGRLVFDEALPDFHEGDPPAISAAPERATPERPSRPRETSADGGTTATSDERRHDARRPLRVWVAGDSMAYNFGLQLERLARRSGVMRVALDAQPSTGLIDRGDVRWLDRLRTSLEQRRPHVFVLSFGANDADVLRHRGVVYGPSRPEWREGYRERARAVMELVGAQRPVYWLGMPVMRSPTYAQKISVMNEVFRDEAARVTGVRFVDTTARFAAPDGSYSAYLADASGQLKLVRMEDGIHYTPEGGRWLATHVFELLCERFIVGGRCP